jgi:hypothetical protein
MTERWSYRISRPDVSLDINLRDVNRVIAELQASDLDVKKAAHRALRRTAGAMRVRVSKAVVPELQLRRAGDIRRRLKQMRQRINKDGGAVGIWVGLNDFAVSKMRGRMREYAGGASFRSIEYPGAFIARVRGRRSIFKRAAKGRFPISEQTVPIKDQIDPILEDDVFPDLIDVFLKNFMSDLRARTVFGVGK